MPQSPVPDVMPVLSRGSHRNPRRGACFMEMASYLAGERWSDHPECTHPLLAAVARNVNDWTSDAGRPQLVPLIPAVVGLTTDDPRTDARIALSCAITALPVAALDAQRALAVAVMGCQQQLGAHGDRDAEDLQTRVRRALDDVPHAVRWATDFTAWHSRDRPTPPHRRFRRDSAPRIVGMSARAIADAAVPGRDPLLLTMLESAIEQCRALQAPPARREAEGRRQSDAAPAAR
jgi:hypothetical protein